MNLLERNKNDLLWKLLFPLDAVSVVQHKKTNFTLLCYCHEFCFETDYSMEIAHQVKMVPYGSGMMPIGMSLVNRDRLNLSQAHDSGVFNYRKISNIRRTKSPNLNYSHFILKSSLPYPFETRC